MRVIRLTLSVLVLLSAMLVSCQDNDNELEIVKKTSDGSVILYSNPFNIIGEHHNQILMQVGINMESIFDTFLDKRTVSDSDIENLLQHSVGAIVNNITLQYAISQDSSYSIVENAINFMRRDDFLSLKGETNEYIYNLIENNTNIDSLILAVFEYEKRLSEYYSLGDTTIVSDLISITVFKYSLLFWKDAFFNTQNPWNSFLIQTYVRKNISYLETKGLLKDIWEQVKNGIKKTTNWVSNNLDHIFTGITIGAIGDFSGASIAARNVPNIYVVAISSAVCSIIGGLTGWTPYTIF